MTSTSLRAGAGSAKSPSVIGVALRAVLEFIGPELRGLRPDDAAPPINLDWIASLTVTAAMALIFVVLGQGAGRRGEDVAPLLFWFGVVLLVVPLTLRISAPRVCRSERLALLFLLAIGLFGYKTAYSPSSFTDHDEFLHWIATDDLMTAKRLFLSNPLLPVGPDYPGLEILTSAAVEITDLPLWPTAALLLVSMRGVFVGALFLFYESITGSARLSAVACLFYMGCSTFVGFDTSFSYESLGIVLCMTSFAIAGATGRLAEEPRAGAFAAVVLLLAALTVTHHLSSAYAAIYFGAVALLEIVRRGASRREIGVAVGLAVVALAMPLLWMWARGNPLVGYLGPVIETGLKSLRNRFQGMATVPKPSIDMPSQPLATRLTTMLGVLLIALGLSTGFFRALARAAPDGAMGWRAVRVLVGRRWRDSRIIVLTFLAFGFPVSTAFRLTVGGWEIGNRMGTFVFLGVGLVVAVGIVHFWQARAPNGWRATLPMLALAVVVMGGVTAASVRPIRGPYRAGADSETVEPMAIETARWTRERLGPGNRFAADRVNRLLLGSYGRQDTKLEMIPGVSAYRIYESEVLPPDDLYALAIGDVDFLLADMRLSRFPSVFGFYFDPGESSHGAPLSPVALLKFDDIGGVARIYDNGWIKIYDVRGLHGRF